jgi:hypothetical protein
MQHAHDMEIGIAFHLASRGSVTSFSAVIETLESGTKIYQEVRKLGVNNDKARAIASVGKRWWQTSQTIVNYAFTEAYFDRLGFPQLTDLNSSNRQVRTRMPGGVGGAA